MPKPENQLRAASRQQLLRFLAGSIHGFTIMAREPANSSDDNAAINERIHRLAGHLTRLLDASAALDDWAVTSIIDDLDHLAPSLRRSAAGHLRSGV